VVALDQDSLTLAPEVGPHLTIPQPALLELDTSRGQKRHWLRGLGAGVLAGVLIGLALPVEPDNCSPESGNLCSRGEAIAGGTIVFGTLGTVVGALIKTERWVPVTLGPRPGLSSARRPGGFQMAVTLRF
jgi:hypothetical protein